VTVLLGHTLTAIVTAEVVFRTIIRLDCVTCPYAPHTSMKNHGYLLPPS
jgi:hypothetical protein